MPRCCIATDCDGDGKDMLQIYNLPKDAAIICNQSIKEQRSYV